MNYFLDCGFYVGQILKEYIERGEVTDEWAVVVFEPNEELDVQADLDRLFPTAEWVKKAVWIHDEGVDFWISQRNNASYIDGMSQNAPEKKITVESLDFSNYVKNLPEQVDKIICSMDIEGAEFPVLDKMIKDGSIDRIDILDVEFHNRVTSVSIERTHELYNEIIKRGVEVRLKVPVIGLDDAKLSVPENW